MTHLAPFGGDTCVPLEVPILYNSNYTKPLQSSSSTSNFNVSEVVQDTSVNCTKENPTVLPSTKPKSVTSQLFTSINKREINVANRQLDEPLSDYLK